MSLAMVSVTFDCAEPRKLAAWWAATLGGDIEMDLGNFVVVRPGESAVTLGFARVPEGKEVKNRVHLDLRAEDREAEVKRLVERGARAVDEHAVPGLTWAVLTDPEGNEFCVGKPEVRAE